MRFRLVSQDSFRVNPRVKTRNSGGTKTTPIYMTLSQKRIASPEMSNQRVAYPPDQIAMESSRRLNAKEPGAVRRQAVMEEISVINAERIEKTANG
jgi:hypothetical protein